jgi:hypothetical protein
LNHEHLPADLCAAFSPSINSQPTTTERRKALEKLYVANYAAIREIASAEPSLLIQDIERLAESVAEHLDEYSGPDDPDLFLDWAASIVQPAAASVAAFYAMHTAHSRIVYKGIWSVLQGCSDLGADESVAEELAQSVWIRIHSELPEWTRPGTAKLSTRLYSRARFAARRWKTDRLRNRAKFLDFADMEEK